MGDLCRRTVTFGGLDFCCQKFSKDVMALKNKEPSLRTQVGEPPCLGRWQQHVWRHPLSPSHLNPVGMRQGEGQGSFPDLCDKAIVSGGDRVTPGPGMATIALSVRQMRLLLCLSCLCGHGHQASEMQLWILSIHCWALCPSWAQKLYTRLLVLRSKKALSLVYFGAPMLGPAGMTISTSARSMWPLQLVSSPES